MSILYLLTAPPPPIEGTDAVFQEVAALRGTFPGEVLNLSPLKTRIGRFPKQLYGLHKLQQIRALEDRCTVNHLFFPSPYPFPVLRTLRNPIVYTITGSLNPAKKPAACAQLRRLRAIVVSNERDAAILKAWGLTNYAIVPTGIDTAKLAPATLPLSGELTLLMASAPWIKGQFDSKGVDLLLATVAKLPFLRVILLWRGVLADELAARVRRLAIEERVEIVNRKVNVNEYLRKAHATILLAKNGAEVRSFPHSLIESLVAAKPVLLNNTIAMADYVIGRRCGVLVPRMTVGMLSSAIETLKRDYALLARHAAQTGPDAFSINKMVEGHRPLYEWKTSDGHNS